MNNERKDEQNEKDTRKTREISGEGKRNNTRNEKGKKTNIEMQEEEKKTKEECTRRIRE